MIGAVYAVNRQKTFDVYDQSVVYFNKRTRSAVVCSSTFLSLPSGLDLKHACVDVSCICCQYLVTLFFS